MVERIGNGSALAREALAAAQKLVPERLERPPSLQSPAASPPASIGELRSPLSGADPTGDFGRVLEAGLGEVEQRVRAAEELPQDLLSGKVSDFHEIAVQLKSSELSFRFSMEIRNKLVDAYREIMRMSV